MFQFSRRFSLRNHVITASIASIILHLVINRELSEMSINECYTASNCNSCSIERQAKLKKMRNFFN